MKSKTILITGGGGYVGSALVPKLLKLNYKVKVIDLFLYGEDTLNNHINLEKINGDIRNIELLKNHIINTDIVIHLAAYNGTKFFYKNPSEVINDNILPTLNLINYFKKKKLKRFIYAGSPESIAGATDFYKYKIPTDEKCPFVVPDPTNNRWSYGNSKALGEQAVILSGLPFTIIRYFNVYGPGQKDHFVSEFYNRIKKKKFEIYGHNNTRTFIYIDDAIKATKLIINNKKANNEIFNIGGDKEIKIKDVANIIMKLLNLKNKIKFFPSPEGSVLRRRPNINKLKKITKFKISTHLKEGLKKTLDV